MTERDKAQPDAAESAGVSRRDFVTRTAAAGAGLVIVPRHVLGRGFQAPSDTVNIATVGVSGMGSSNTSAVMSQNIVAFCDVDFGLARRAHRALEEGSASRPPRADRATAAGRAAARADGRPARREREASAQQSAPRTSPGSSTSSCRRSRSIATTARCSRSRRTSTASSSRRPITCTPRSRRRRWTSASTSTCRSRSAGRSKRRGTLAKKAKDNPKIVTQMGNQGHSRDEARLGYEYITSGAIGDVREVHVWTNRPLGYWPQGVPRPAPLPARLQDRDDGGSRWRGPDVDAQARGGAGGHLPALRSSSPWDLFLGVAPPVDYHPIYHPFNWRGWVDWGQGALGDMGAHLIDHPFWSLKLGMPDRHRDQVDAVQRRVLSARDDDLLRVPGARQHAGRQADVVRRRAHAAQAGRDRRRESQRRRRDPLHRQQGQDDAGDLRAESAPAARLEARVDAAPEAGAAAHPARSARDELGGHDSRDSRRFPARSSTRPSSPK